ncbi:MAG: 3-isopropylmalate dehydratase small subunit [Firmicutes bacterium]|nr:3-isopropylmalate dehydratase small subunit [Bacillota bacterium]MDI6705780.1 3-isopropylmalate dehydratase small subunit [Bacillota bacterium]
MILEGRVWKCGDNIDTDVIIPARYLNSTSPEELGKYCMADMDPDFAKKIVKGDIIVAGRNFGCGSSREHAPTAIKAAGISCVIAISFARIFYRNAINIGLPILECPQLISETYQHNILSVNLANGLIMDKSSNREYQAKSFPPFIQEIIKAGGLLNYVRRVE